MNGPMTEAELVRRVTEELLRRMGTSAPSPAASVAKSPGLPGSGTSLVQTANDSGFCQIFPDPTPERTLASGYIPIGISARHCHVTQGQLEVLFGPGTQLEPLKPLKQTGQFASKQLVTILGPRGRAIERVRILGPCREDTQVEVSLTDCIALGLDAPVRPSGVHVGTPGILMAGPKGFIAMERGVIRANRHIHLHTDEAALLGLRDNQSVMIKIDGDRPVVYFDVQVRVGPRFSCELHLDTDDANAVGLRDGAVAQIIRKVSDIPACGCMPG